MKVLTFPGCWYTDAIPQPLGAYVSSHFHSGLLSTDKGMNQAPAKPRVLQWVRLSPGGIWFAGTGQDDDHAWEWQGDKWADAGPFKAPRAVIYDAAGELIVEREASWPGPGSQGWRYVDQAGELVPAWVTYASPTKRLWEFTTHGDVVVGQGEGGVHALVADRRVRLDYLVTDNTGQPAFGQAPQTLAVNFWRWSDNCAISFYVVHSATEFTGVAIWLTRQEFDALPTFEIGTAPSEPLPVPIPDPEPTVPDSLLPTVEQIWLKYGGQNRGAMLNEIAWTHRADGWGLSRKEGGHFVESPVGKIASDILQAKETALEGQIGQPQPGPSFPTKLALKSAHGKYFSVQPDGQVIANRDGVDGDWEVIHVEPQP
jgi:hypothetical protein